MTRAPDCFYTADKAIRESRAEAAELDEIVLRLEEAVEKIVEEELCKTLNW